MISQKQFSIFFVLLFSLTNFFPAFAQTDGVGEDGPPSNPATSNADDVNIYLQDNSPKPVDTTVKSPAQIANGKLAGNYSTRLSCPYNFERDIYAGVKGEDVRLLQVILNSDKRTLISYSGPGSAGNETTLFGPATKDAVKRFQALFIEYIGIANGRFGPRTRTVMNAVCNGTAQTNSGQSYGNVQTVQNSPANINTAVVENTQTASESIPPRVSLSANLNAVQRGDYFKVIVNLSEEIQKFTPESVIVDGGTVKEIRKLSKVSYVMTITPNDDAKVVVVQVEADTLQDLVGNKNDFASNEVNVRVLTPVVPGQATTTDSNSLDALLNKVISSAPTCTYNSTGQLITGANINTTGCANTSTSNTQMYDCYGQQIPNTQQCPYDPYRAQQQQQAQQQANQQAQQAGQGLGALLGKLLGGGGSGSGDKSGQQSQTGPQTQSGPPSTTGPASTTTPPPSTPQTQADKDKASLDALLKACDGKANSDECKALQAKVDAAKNGSPAGSGDNLDKVNQKILKCSTKENADIFCTTKGKELLGPGLFKSSYMKIYGIDKQGTQFLAVTQGAVNGMDSNSCLLQQPSIVPEKYDSVKIIGCAKTENDCKTKPKDKLIKPDGFTKVDMSVYGWKISNTNADRGNILSSGKCILSKNDFGVSGNTNSDSSSNGGDSSFAPENFAPQDTSKCLGGPCVYLK